MKKMRIGLTALFIMLAGSAFLFAQTVTKPTIISFSDMAAAIEKNQGPLFELDLEMKGPIPVYTAKAIVNSMEVTIYYNAANGTETGRKPPKHLDYEDGAVYGYIPGNQGATGAKPKITSFSDMAAAIEKSQGPLLELDLEMTAGMPMYKAKAVINGMKVIIYYNAATGTETGRNPPKYLDYEEGAVYGYRPGAPAAATGTAPGQGTQPVQITIDKAREIGLARTGGGMVAEIGLDHERGRLVYDMEIYNNNLKYELYVDAYTGEVIKFKQDW